MLKNNLIIMKIIVQELCELFREQLDIPIHDVDLPAERTTPFIVIKQDTSNDKKQGQEFHINIYVPNKVRTFKNLSDNSYPDIETIDYLEKSILAIYQEFIEPYRKSKIHIRKYIKKGNMHYLNLCMVFS